MTKRKTGVAEWAEHSANLYVGCEHGCRYCYARERALRFKQIKSPEEWTCPKPLKNPKRYRRKVDGGIMFPTTHDITPANLPQCRVYLEEMLRAGNRVLIVTKPHWFCIDHLCAHLRLWREQLEFRFTIGAQDDALLKLWEPAAPTYSERARSIFTAYAVGYRTSVSIEPMLDAEHVQQLVHDARRAASESIWIGKMNDIRRRVQIVTDEDRRQVERIEEGQTDERIMEIVRALKDDPLIRWKDSIQKVIERCQR